MRIPSLLMSSSLVLGLLAGPPVLAACDDPANEIANCGFDTDAAGWSATQGSCARDTLLDPSNPSFRCDSASDGFGGHRVVVAHACLTTVVEDTYGFGGDSRLDAGSVTCTIDTVPNDGMACDGGQTTGAASAALAPGSGAFAQSAAASASFGTGTQSATFTVTCNGAAPYTIYFDDFFLGVGLVPVELLSVAVE